MRRLIAASALVGLVLLGAACDRDTTVTPSSAPPTTASPSPTPTVDPSANTRAVCDAVEKATLQSVDTFTKEISGKVAQAAAQGTNAKQAAVSLVKEWMGDWADAIRAEAAKAADPALRTVLIRLAAQIDAGGAKIKSFADLDKVDQIMNSAEMDAVSKDLSAYCPNLA